MLGYRTMALASAFSAALLTACGGGGGGSVETPEGNAMTFPLQAGYKALINSGYTINFDVSGSCTGTGTQVNQQPVAATFEGVAGFSVTSVQSITLPSCGSTSTITGTATDYFDANLAALGSAITGGDYGVYQSAATLPVTVKVGDKGPFGTELVYTDGSKATPTGKDVFSYEISADTGSTAIGTLTTQEYDTNDALVFTEQDRYRIAADGGLTLLSVDIQYAGSNALHLVLTPK